MSKGLSQDKRNRLKDSNLSVRRTAKAEGVSPTTVLTWRKRKGVEDKPRNKFLLSAQRPLFIELVRLSRYRYQYLFDYLSPIWPVLPSSSRIEEDQRSLSNMTFRRLLADYPQDSDMEGCLLKHHGNTIPGIVAVHRIKAKLKIHFDIRLIGMNKTPESGYREIEILLFIERFSGLIYGKAFRRGERENFLMALSRFDQMLPYPIKELSFVTSTPSTSSDLLENRTKTIAEALSFDIDIKSDPATSIKSFLDRQKLTSVKFSFKPYTPYQQQRLLIPFSPYALYSYTDLWSFNKDLQKVINIVNMKKRFRMYRGKRYDISPLSKLTKHVTVTKKASLSLQEVRKKILKKIKLPRPFRHDDWKKPAQRES